MGYIEAVILGVVQGLTEFLPVSSSGHLALGHLLWGEVTRSSRAFDVLVHGATLIVILGAFGRVFVRLLRRKGPFIPLVVLALLPTAFVGIWWRHEMAVLGTSPWILAACFATTGFFLWVLGRWCPGSEGGGKPIEELDRMGWWVAFAVGLSQALAIAPGVSRSGMTIASGQLCGITPDLAVSFSFVLGAPAILAALVAEAHPIGELALADPGPLAAGFAAALVSGCLAVGLLKRMARRGTLPRFAPYCFLMAALCLLLAEVK